MKIENGDKLEVTHINKEIANIKFNDRDFVATCKFTELNEEGFF